MKNRIWKQMKKVGIVTVLAGAMLGGTIEPEDSKSTLLNSSN